MGCNNSTEEVDTSVSVLPGPAAKSTRAVAPAPEVPSHQPMALKPEAELGSPQTAKPDVAKADAVKPPQCTSPAECEPHRAVFPVPEGWRVVCRLSAGDVRSRWGTRPRPAPAGTASAPIAGTAFEADLVLPELNQPLHLPLQLLPQWTDPRVGTEFIGRYEVRRSLPERPGCRGQLFEVFDQHERAECALQVCNLLREEDVKQFVERLQLESLDSEKRLFFRLRDVALALPGRLAVIEDIPRHSMWQEFKRLEPGTNLAAKVAAIANSVLGGLCRLHAHGWAHCGVSPLTVCLALDGAWKLTSLESAKRVGDLAADPLATTGTTSPPEALLGLPVTEKVDVWQLAATLCEAITQQRVGCPEGDATVAERMCTLVNFLGALPNSLVAQHPNREDLFTPEGHVLRPVTPDAAGAQALEAIEPTLLPAGPEDDGERIPRPHLVAKALDGVEGANDILEFIGRLLSPDPEQRPSAAEAMAHHFLRFAHTKGAAAPGDDVVAMEQLAEAKQAKSTQTEGDPTWMTSCAVHRKSTGTRPEHVKIEDAHGDNESRIRRKGTGFVQLGELPPSDDEDDEEEEEEQEHRPEHVTINDTHGDNENRITRKGTGFVQLGELPPSDDEDDEEEDEEEAHGAHVQIQDSHGDNENRIVRKGTGFVQLGELPPSDSEEEEEEEEEAHPSSKGHVKIQDEHDDNANRLVRKGTGFVHIGELPPSDDEEEEEEEEEREEQGSRRVQISDAASTRRGQGMVRKGTGFVQARELPPDEEEGEEEPAGPAKAHSKVRIDDAHQDNSSSLQRKGTGFVYINELPPSDDEDSEDEEEAPVATKSRVTIQDSHGDNTNSISRKGTGFVNLADLPDDLDDEEEEEEERQGQQRVEFAKVDSTDCSKEHKAMRKGTGLVNMNEIPDTDDEEEEAEEAPAALQAP